MLHRMVSRSVVVIAATALLASCEDNTTGTPPAPPPASTAVNVNVAPPAPTTGDALTTVTPAAVFKVTYPDGSVATGQVVNFSLNLGGVIAQQSGTVDASGSVSPGEWILGPRCATQRLIATPVSGNAAFIDVAPTPQLFMWHSSGLILERVDFTCGVPAVGTGEIVSLDGEITALTYNSATGLLVGGDFNSNYFTLDPATGTQTVLGTVGASWLAGLAFELGATPRLLGVMQTNANLYSIDPTTGAATLLGTMTLVGQTIQFATGLATDPTTGTIYGILNLASSPVSPVPGGGRYRSLVTINPTTFVVTNIGILGQAGMSDLAFGADGTLYGVTGDGGTSPSTLFKLSKTNAATSPYLALGNGGNGEAIAAVP